MASRRKSSRRRRDVKPEAQIVVPDASALEAGGLVPADFVAQEPPAAKTPAAPAAAPGAGAAPAAAPGAKAAATAEATAAAKSGAKKPGLLRRLLGFARRHPLLATAVSAFAAYMVYRRSRGEQPELPIDQMLPPLQDERPATWLNALVDAARLKFGIDEKLAQAQAAQMNPMAVLAGTMTGQQLMDLAGQRQLLGMQAAALPAITPRREPLYERYRAEAPFPRERPIGRAAAASGALAPYLPPGSAIEAMIGGAPQIRRSAPSAGGVAPEFLQALSGLPGILETE